MVMRPPFLGGGDGLPLEVSDGTHPLRPEQLEAADLNASEKDDRGPRVYLGDGRRCEGCGDVDSTGGQESEDTF